MKKVIMYFFGAMMVVSLAACTPTTQKKQPAETKQSVKATEHVTETTSGEPLANSVVTDRPVDREAPELKVVSIYTVQDDRHGLEGTMDSIDAEGDKVEELVALLIQYGTLEKGTTIINYEASEPIMTQDIPGPGASAEDSHIIMLADYIENATLDLSAIPDDGQDRLVVDAVAKTFIENLNIQTFTLKLNGEAIAENVTELDLE